MARFILFLYLFQIETAKKDHEKALKAKCRLERMLKDRDEFVDDLTRKRTDVFAVIVILNILCLFARMELNGIDFKGNFISIDHCKQECCFLPMMLVLSIRTHLISAYQQPDTQISLILIEMFLFISTFMANRFAKNSANKIQKILRKESLTTNSLHSPMASFALTSAYYCS